MNGIFNLNESSGKIEFSSPITVVSVAYSYVGRKNSRAIIAISPSVSPFVVAGTVTSGEMVVITGDTDSVGNLLDSALSGVFFLNQVVETIEVICPAGAIEIVVSFNYGD